MATAKSFEASLGKLEEAVERLESGDLTLDQAMKIFSAGVKEADQCRRSLKEVELKIEQLQTSEDGSFRRQEIDGH
jgi:exodeoxyribonuclease VII small subunit